MSEYKRVTMSGYRIPENKEEVHANFRLLYNRLAELEDKLEQGTLIELPCKVGDTVYFIVQYIKPFIEEYVVDGIEIGRENYLRCYHKHKKGYAYFMFEQIFLTKAEAEKRLKEQL